MCGSLRVARLFRMDTDYGRTRSGKPITENLIEELVTKAEAGFPVLSIIKTPWRGRFLFYRWYDPFPYLLDRYSVVDDKPETTWYAGFWFQRSAEKYIEAQ